MWLLFPLQSLKKIFGGGVEQTRMNRKNKQFFPYLIRLKLNLSMFPEHVVS